MQADLKSALTSTDWIPCFTGQTMFTLFRNQPVIDGGCAPAPPLLPPPPPRGPAPPAARAGAAAAAAAG